MSSLHSRNQSEESNATATSYNMILEHVLQYPGSYEIPLRTMYTLNCAPRAQPLPKDLSSRAPSPMRNSGTASPMSGNFAWNDAEATTMDFTSQLMSHLGSLPVQPSSLPPSFVVSFVSRCFHPCLALVDFPQALTALDYMRDLEKRRCKEYVMAFERLGIRIESFEADVAAVAERYPGVALWAKNMHGKNKKAETFYSVLYLGLRRWIMINELSLQPFNRLNCTGMLNTLLPPQSPSGNSKLPTPLLTHKTLKEERDHFFEYIGSVKKNGPKVLQPVIDLNKAPGDETGWDQIQRTVDKYLRVAKSTIDDCISTTGIDNFKEVEENRKGKKTDSGVSFGSDKRPSTASSNLEKSLPALPFEAKPVTKGLSKLERITREFKRMRVKPRLDVEEIVKVDKHNTASRPSTPVEEPPKRSLKKSRSLANLTHFRSANSSSMSLSSKKISEIPFDAEEMRRQRMLYEASTATANKASM